MKLGIESRNKTIAAGALVLIAIYLFWHSFFGGGGVASPPPAPAQFAGAAREAQRPANNGAARRTKASAELPPENPLDPRLRLALLKTSEDTNYQGAGRNIFRAEAEEVIPKPIAPGVTDHKATPEPPPVPQGPPPPPPIPLKFFGFANRAGGAKQIFLSKGDEVFVAKEGDVVDRHYKVIQINVNPNSVVIEDLINNNRQTIPMTAGQS